MNSKTVLGAQGRLATLVSYLFCCHDHSFVSDTGRCASVHPQVAWHC